MTKFHFNSAQDSKEISITMPVMMSKIFKFLGFIKTQKSRYLVNETLFFPQIKKFTNYT